MIETSRNYPAVRQRRAGHRALVQQIIVAAQAVVLCAACAMGENRVRLHPVVLDGTSGPTRAAPAQGRMLGVLTPVDLRGGQPDLIGVILNGLGQVYGRLRTDTDVPKWVSESLSGTLATYGYAPAGTDDTSAIPVSIRVSVNRVFIASDPKQYGLFRSEIDTHVEVFRRGKVISKERYAAHTQPAIAFLTARTFAEALDDAMRGFLEGNVPAISAAIDDAMSAAD